MPAWQAAEVAIALQGRRRLGRRRGARTGNELRENARPRARKPMCVLEDGDSRWQLPPHDTKPRDPAQICGRPRDQHALTLS
jgi:hypothetical protein